MSVEEQIEGHIAGQPAAKGADMRALHARLLDLAPDCRLWFLDGRDETGKVVTNPNIGYGVQTTEYAGGETREFYQVGVSANASGLSLYLMGERDRTYLPATYGERIGKAKVTGYCVKFRRLDDLDGGVLDEMLRDHLARTG